VCKITLFELLQAQQLSIMIIFISPSKHW